MPLSDRTKSFIADTLSLVVFFTIASGLNERFIAGMTWDEVLVSRSIGAPLMVLTARPYGLWRDWFMKRTDPSGKWSRLAMDSLALLIFQLPIYVAIIVAGGADGFAILKGAAGFAALLFVLGRPYGVFLELVRGFFGLKGQGQKPMSVGG
ncbi:L-alanine exporter AlaE [Aurantimonas sp. VKM B-3413]|uniref:L-alanine exporter AlaE n=1 Tax=Aurantimonas sp. VKM B-3413 TaxID=2779401 RepID=UPI001E3EB831|nr:L-alanine exporter AlaE [Aurantimonas sp. VKM B-3413]